MISNPGANGNDENVESMDRTSMEQLMESSFQDLREGEVVRGTVVAINEDIVMVDIGYKSEGTVSVEEFRDKRTGELTISVGDEVEIYIERMDPGESTVRLSRERASKLKTWTAIEEAYKSAEPVTGKVVERVKGGLSVDIGIRAFLPGSLVDLRLNRPLEDYIGEEISAKVISFDRRRSNIVLSRKAVLEEERSEVKEATLASLEEGKLVTGSVKNITDYGVFIELGGLDGLLHITDISWGRVGHPSEYFAIGDEVDVVILRFDRERERVSLGYKQRFEDPWVLVPEKYPVGKRLTGKIVSIVDYGAFVELEEGVEGLIHVSEMSWTKKVKNPRSVVQVGQEVDVVVSEVDIEKRRLSLSLRATEPNPWETVAETYHVGSRIQGVVRNLTDFGAFVEIVPGVDGLVHISDMSWTRRIAHPSEVVQKGQEVEAVVTSIDVVQQRISLSMKELLPNEWEEYANAHGVGDIVGGSVTNITDFGVFVELAPGVEGLCHISEIDRVEGAGLSDTFVSGQRVRCRILRVDWNENRIGLSMHSVSQDDVDEEETPAGRAPAERDTAMAAALRAGGLLPEAGAEPAEAEEAPAEPEVAPAEEAPAEAEVAPAEEAPAEAEVAAVEEAPAEAEVAAVEEAPAKGEKKAKPAKKAPSKAKKAADAAGESSKKAPAKPKKSSRKKTSASAEVEEAAAEKPTPKKKASAKAKKKAEE